MNLSKYCCCIGHQVVWVKQHSVGWFPGFVFLRSGLLQAYQIGRETIFTKQKSKIRGGERNTFFRFLLDDSYIFLSNNEAVSPFLDRLKDLKSTSNKVISLLFKYLPPENTH